MHLGGADFDKAILNYCINMINENRQFDWNTKRGKRAKLRLLEACREAKQQLSTADSYTIEVQSLFPTNEEDEEDNGDFSHELTRAEFETICEELFQRLIKPIDAALRDAGYNREAIERVILAGGSTRILKVQQLLIEYFGNRVNILNKADNPDESVSKGACILAGILQGAEDLESFTFTDVISHSLGVAVNQIGDDDESNETLHVVVEKNTPFPLDTPKKVTFCTGLKDQTSARVKILQGRETGDSIKDCQVLSELVIDELPKGEAGTVLFDVEFDID